MAANMAGRSGLILSRSTLSSIRLAIPGRHAPNLKKKAKQGVLQKKKKTGISLAKSREIVPPVDPESHTNPYLLEPDRQRQKIELSVDEQEKNILLEKEWSRFQMEQHREDLMRIQRMIKSREEALKELKKCSIFLYEEAIKVDKSMFPLTMKGPTETPPIQDYFAPEPDLRKT